MSVTRLPLPQNLVPSSGATSRGLSASRQCRALSHAVYTSEARSSVSTTVRLLIHRAARPNSFTLGVAHVDRTDWQKPIVEVDCLREAPPPFSPSTVVEDFARVLKSYNVNKVIGDKFAGAWPVETFGKLSITYEQSAAPKSDLYRDLLPLINSGRIRLLDHPKLINQLIGLERRVSRGGRNSIDHGPGAHDDIANCIAGVASITNRYPGYLGPAGAWSE